VVLVRRGTELARWPLSRWDCHGLAAVDRLARLQLAARRLGWSIELRGADAELLELLDLVGLREVVLSAPVYGWSWAGRPKAAKRSGSTKL
jgi:ABC-type transporter Mla MlaB component